MEPPPPKLSLFALPSQTTILFAGILMVVVAPLLVGLVTPRYQLLLPLLPVVALLFTLWDFLIEPLRRLDDLGATPLPPEGDWLAAHVTALAREVATTPPILRVSATLLAPFVVGTWRQRWLVLPAWFLDEWPHGPDDPVIVDRLEVILRHELAHFVNHDAWLTALARSLLKMTLAVVATYGCMWFWNPLLYRSGLAYLPLLTREFAPLLAFFPAELQAVVYAPPAMTTARAITFWLELAMALAPLAAGILFLWRRDWNLLLRVREVYADARVAEWLGDVAPLETTLNWFIPLVRARQSAAPTSRRNWRFWKRWSRVPATQPLGWGLEASLRGTLAPKPQPGPGMRRAVLQRPDAVYGTSKQIGVRAGVIVLLFYVIQGSLLAPVRVGIGLELAIGAGFVALALGLTPLMLVKLSEPQTLRRETTTAVGWFMLVLIVALTPFMVLAVISAVVWPQAMDIVLYAIAGVSPEEFAPVFDDPIGYAVQVAVGAFVAFVIAAPLVLWGSLWLDARLKQRILTWYAAPWLAQRSALVFGAVTLVLGSVLWLGVLPLVSLLVFPLILEIDEGLLVSLAVAAMILLAAGVSFWRSDRRWHGRCPTCGGVSAATPQLGARCEHCHASLAPWLLARY